MAIVGAGVFAISQLTGESASGGAATPEEAGLAMLAAIEDEDVLGMIDVLLPGERETLRGPVTDLVDELRGWRSSATTPASPTSAASTSSSRTSRSR